MHSGTSNSTLSLFIRTLRRDVDRVVSKLALLSYQWRFITRPLRWYAVHRLTLFILNYHVVTGRLPLLSSTGDKSIVVGPRVLVRACSSIDILGVNVAAGALLRSSCSVSSGAAALTYGSVSLAVGLGPTHQVSRHRECAACRPSLLIVRALLVCLPVFIVTLIVLYMTRICQAGRRFLEPMVVIGPHGRSYGFKLVTCALHCRCSILLLKLLFEHGSAGKVSHCGSLDDAIFGVSLLGHPVVGILLELGNSLFKQFLVP